MGYLNKICCKFTSESDSEKKLKSVNIWESYGQEFGVLFLTHGVVLLVLFTKLIRWTGRKRLVTQPGGLTLGFALHLVCTRIMIRDHRDRLRSDVGPNA